MDQIPAKLGVDEDTARATVATALPSLVLGMSNNASTAEGAKALQSAVAGHHSSVVEDRVDVDAIDTHDGQKIVDHVLGDSQSALAARLNAEWPEGFDLGGLLGGSQSQQGQTKESQAAVGGLDIGGILGVLFGNK